MSENVGIRECRGLFPEGEMLELGVGECDGEGGLLRFDEALISNSFPPQSVRDPALEVTRPGRGPLQRALYGDIRRVSPALTCRVVSVS